MTSKQNVDSERPVLFLYICSIYVAATHFATIFYKKTEQKSKKWTGLSLLNFTFDVTDEKITWQLPVSHRLVRVKPKVILKSLNANYITMKKIVVKLVFLPSPLEGEELLIRIITAHKSITITFEIIRIFL